MTTEQLEQPRLKGSRRAEDLEHRIDAVNFKRDEVTCGCGKVFTQEAFKIHRVPFSKETH